MLATTAAAVGALALNEFTGGANFVISRPSAIRGAVPSWQIGAVSGFASSFFVEALNNLMNAVDKKYSLNQLPSFVTHMVGGASGFAAVPALLYYGGLFVAISSGARNMQLRCTGPAGWRRA